MHYCCHLFSWSKCTLKLKKGPLREVIKCSKCLGHPNLVLSLETILYSNIYQMIVTSSFPGSTRRPTHARKSEWYHRVGCRHRECHYCGTAGVPCRHAQDQAYCTEHQVFQIALSWDIAWFQKSLESRGILGTIQRVVTNISW